MRFKDAMCTAYADYTKARSKVDDLCDTVDPYRAWYKQTLGYWKKRKSLPRRISRKPLAIRNRLHY